MGGRCGGSRCIEKSGHSELLTGFIVELHSSRSRVGVLLNLNCMFVLLHNTDLLCKLHPVLSFEERTTHYFIFI